MARRFCTSLGFAPLALAVFVFVFAAPVRGADAPELSDLVNQLDGKACAIESTCKRRSFVAWGVIDRWWLALVKRHPDLNCRKDAAVCLEAMGPDARPVLPALKRAVQSGPSDYDTGDGAIKPLSAALSAIGAIGDPATIPLLVDYIAAPREWEASNTASPARALGFAGVESALEALARFGAKARSALPVLRAALTRGELRFAHATLLKTLRAIDGPE